MALHAADQFRMAGFKLLALPGAMWLVIMRHALELNIQIDQHAEAVGHCVLVSSCPAPRGHL